MPCGRKRKRHKISTHKRKKRLRKNRHKKKDIQDSGGYQLSWIERQSPELEVPGSNPGQLTICFLYSSPWIKPGCGAVRLARFLGVEEVAGSNPVIPTMGLFTTVGVIPKSINFGVQRSPASAFASGAKGRGFESRHPDHIQLQRLFKTEYSY